VPLEAIFKGLTVPGTSSPEETVNLLFQRVKNTEAAINVPGGDLGRGGVQQALRARPEHREHGRRTKEQALTTRARRVRLLCICMPEREGRCGELSR
jgi:hypothetical protein